MDYILWCLTLAFVSRMGGPSDWSAIPLGELPFTLIVVWSFVTASWVLPEAILLAWMGTTPGKWVLGLDLRAPDGARLRFRAALARSLRVWVIGSGGGLYPIALVAYWRSYAALRARGTVWEHYGTLAGSETRFVAGMAVVVCVGAQVGTLGVLARSNREDAALLEAQEQVREHGKRVMNWFHGRGVDLEIAREVETVRIERRGVHEVTIRIEAGGTLAIVTGCSGACEDLDLVLFDPAGEEQARDQEADDHPFVTFEPKLAGDYRLVFMMADCAGASCVAGYQVLRSARVLPAQGTGTGFLVDPSGSILTALHVVEDAGAISVGFSDGTVAEARIVATSKLNDVALLRARVVKPKAFLSLSRPSTSVVGEEVFVVGFPAPDLLGQESKVTDGSITSLSGYGGDHYEIQISAPTQPGNSGGPVINARGEVVGILTSSVDEEAFQARSGTLPQLVNWATKSEIAYSVVPPAQSTPRWTSSSKAEAVVRARDAVVSIWAGPADRVPKAASATQTSDSARTSASKDVCTPQESCCRVCRKGKACGHSCISRSDVCVKEKGCACDATQICRAGGVE